MLVQAKHIAGILQISLLRKFNMTNFVSVGTAIEKNKLFSDVAFINLMEIEVINPTNKEYIETIYVANNQEDIEYQGHTYVASAFSIQSLFSGITGVIF